MCCHSPRFAANAPRELETSMSMIAFHTPDTAPANAAMARLLAEMSGLVRILPPVSLPQDGCMVASRGADLAFEADAPAEMGFDTLPV